MWCEWVETYAPDKWTAFFYSFFLIFELPVLQLVHEDVFKYCKID